MGCENIHKFATGWRRHFYFVQLKDMGVESLAKHHIECGIRPKNGVVVAHSAGCTVATLYAAEINKLVEKGELPHDCKVRKLILIAPAQVAGRLLPTYLVKEMLKRAAYILKGLPFAKSFMPYAKDLRRWMSGSDIDAGTEATLISSLGKWFPKIISAWVTKPFNPRWWFRDLGQELRDQGVEVVVVRCLEDRMITPKFAKQVSEHLQASIIFDVNRSHMGPLVGHQSEGFIARLMTEIYWRPA